MALGSAETVEVHSIVDFVVAVWKIKSVELVNRKARKRERQCTCKVCPSEM